MRPTLQTLRLLKNVKAVLVDATYQYTEIMKALKYEAMKEANRSLYANVQSDSDPSFAKRFFVIRRPTLFKKVQSLLQGE